MNKGFIQAVGAYTIWGISPIFWKGLSEISAMYSLAHRIFWTFAVMALIQTLRRSWPQFREQNLSRRSRFIGVVSSLLIGTNWLVWVWAMNVDRVVEGSLGYFINPLVSVFLGVVFLGESLRRNQWLAVILAAIGVTWLTFSVGSLPWVSLVLAGTFGLYGLSKKLTEQSPMNGLTSEMSVLVIPALIYFFFRTFDGTETLSKASSTELLLLVASGLFTAAPLLLFANAVKEVPLSIIGLLQFLAPTAQFLLGVLAYDENFDMMQLVGFIIIWSALIIFITDSFRSSKSSL
ncbi:MAG: EamA family transporter RarD [Acidimicrobiales bacterium]|nr:EamA family transporter RarD [Acidimicrobiales bacterium]|tara:strand:- start:29 stop:901 length:873 start_codon:yes stop_codon:yes gene_type:complete